MAVWHRHLQRSEVWHRVAPSHRNLPLPARRRLGYAVSLAAFLAAAIALAGIVVSTPQHDAASSDFVRCGSYAPLASTRSGVVRPVTNQAELASALATARPGDTVNLASGRYREVRYRSDYGHRSGTVGRPI